MTSSHPVNERLLSLDFLRGIAVLGLLLMNVSSMGLFHMEAEVNTEGAFDSFVITLQILFFDGRFRSIFCLLFGIGLYLQYLRFQQLNFEVLKVLKSRLNWLFIIGLCHCVFIWAGDILMIYALSGIVMIKHFEKSSAVLLKRGYIYFIMGTVIMILCNLLLAYSELGDAGGEWLLLSYAELLEINFIMAIAYIFTFPVLSMFYFCGVMYIGIGLFRNGTLKEGFSKTQLHSLVAVTVVCTLTDLWLFNESSMGTKLTTEVFSSISGLTMALIFWHWVVVTKCYEHGSKLVIAIRALGRRALSFYLLQSLVMTTLLRFIFPQWNTDFTLINYLCLALAFIPIQLILAYYYDRYFIQGPFEYWWRKRITLTLKPQ